MRSLIAWFDRHHLYSLGRFIVGLMYEPVATLTAAFFYLLRYKNPEVLTEEEKKRAPILLLHGNKHNSSAWFFLIRRLKRAGLSPLFTVDLPSGAVTEKDFAIISGVLEKIRALYGGRGPKPILIGHSRGAYLAVQVALQEDVGQVITLGTPAGEVEAKALSRLYEIDALYDVLVEERSTHSERVEIRCGHVGLLYSKEVFSAIITHLHAPSYNVSSK